MKKISDRRRLHARRLAWIVGLAVTGVQVSAQTAPAASAPPPFVARGMPGAGQDTMKPLAGDWRVSMWLYAALGTPDHPVQSDDIKSHREWVAGGRFLTDVTEGTVGGQAYYRRGTLGYSSVDKRYEWVTQDALNANMMVYAGAKGSGPGLPANLRGSFTDQGLLGEKYAGKTIGQRTVIRIVDNDHHEMLIYFTPPGEPERLVDRKVYTRVH